MRILSKGGEFNVIREDGMLRVDGKRIIFKPSSNGIVVLGEFISEAVAHIVLYMLSSTEAHFFDLGDPKLISKYQILKSSNNRNLHVLNDRYIFMAFSGDTGLCIDVEDFDKNIAVKYLGDSYTTELDLRSDDIGGLHSSTMNISPSGKQCSNCTLGNCVICKGVN